MKKEQTTCLPFKFWLAIIFLFFIPIGVSFAQDTLQAKDEYVREKTYLVIKNDGTEFIGDILEDDGREILINTTRLGKLYIPKHEIKSISLIDNEEILSKKLPEDDFFSSRYFITTNGFTQKKGNHYLLIHLFGPEVQFAITDNITVGGLTTWVGMPIVLSAKYSAKITENLHIGVGALGGSLSWVNFEANGVLPYAAITVGNLKYNLTFSGGGIFVQDQNDSFQSALFSVAGMARLGKKVSFIVDSYGFRETNNNNVFIIMPGIRLGDNKSAFQIGLTQVYYHDDFIPFPIPTLGWFKRF
ncbi:MAG: hypothetical protein COX70_00225 [Flavobacteriales bacterium CG_4_10_14_0_2_um_filter_32_8]|nr:MAG: hypothetical protein COX70_00225 [Flavobacteriales bacterium CG_4_10_14_0_2_um_filter_32_8]PJB15240.1 MAG: hypothetical protein CO118_04385 [Flavobacteriales bacterium CG_4_9_14_3_um_filter_32_8]